MFQSWCWTADVWTRPFHGRLWGGDGPEAGVCLLVRGAGAQWVLGLMPAHWWAELGPRVSGCGALGVPALVPACWCGGPRSESSDGCGLVGEVS